MKYYSTEEINEMEKEKRIKIAKLIWVDRDEIQKSM